MANYKRRFTKDEFREELFAHLRDIPPGHLQNAEKLERSASIKAEHYAQALDALDSAVARIRKLAELSSESLMQNEADAAIKEINEAINAYGEASLSGNSSWRHNSTEDDEL